MDGDFVPTHKSIGGVPAQAFPDGTIWRVRIGRANTGIFSDSEFKMLFEPLPPPSSVTVSRAALSNVLRCIDGLSRTDKPCGYSELQRAIQVPRGPTEANDVH